MSTSLRDLGIDVTDEGEVEFIQMAELSQGESTSAAGLDIKSVPEATISTALNMQTNRLHCTQLIPVATWPRHLELLTVVN